MQRPWTTRAVRDAGILPETESLGNESRDALEDCEEIWTMQGRERNLASDGGHGADFCEGPFGVAWCCLDDANQEAMRIRFRVGVGQLKTSDLALQSTRLSSVQSEGKQ